MRIGQGAWAATETGLGCSDQCNSFVKPLQCAPNMGKALEKLKDEVWSPALETLRFITRGELVYRGETPKSSPARTGRQPGRDDIGVVFSRMSRRRQERWQGRGEAEEEHSREKHEQAKARCQTWSSVFREKCGLEGKPGVLTLASLAGHPHSADPGPAVSLQ